MAHVPELMGCSAAGRTRHDALENLRRAISEHLAWLANHREVAPPSAESGEVEIEVVEEVATTGSFPRKPGEPAAFFATDEEALSHHDLQTAVRLLAHARGDMLDFLRDVPDSLLHWRPSLDEPSIAELLAAVAYAEAGYLACLDEQSERYPFPQLAAIRSWAYHRLGRMTEAELSRSTTHHDEKWSARKVLRRLLEQEREHTAYVHSLLARYRREAPNA
jgi:predicted RNase H-like HicB family nuclease